MNKTLRLKSSKMRFITMIGGCLLKSRRNELGVHKLERHRGKILFIASGVLTVLLIVSILAFLSLQSQKPQTNTNVIFTYCSSLSGETFTITTDINLTDGMDQGEAIKVATKVFEKVFDPGAHYQLESLQINSALHESGIWAVRFDWSYVSRDLPSITHAGEYQHLDTKLLRGSFVMMINSFDQTVYGSSGTTG